MRHEAPQATGGRRPRLVGAAFFYLSEALVWQTTGLPQR